MASNPVKIDSMPGLPKGSVLAWGFDNIEANTIDQAAMSSRLPFVEGHVALMPDAHVGIGSTVGSVIPTRGAIIPSCIGVDIGCGMIAVETNLTSHALPGSLDGLLSHIGQAVPAGLGKQFDKQDDRYPNVTKLPPWIDTSLSGPGVDLLSKACKQFGTLGSGNHFVEVCLDEQDTVWVVLHSGSRGAGNKLAQKHINGAKKLMQRYFIDLEDPDLAYLVEGSLEFKAYITDMQWAQDYAAGNRDAMMDAVLQELWDYVAPGVEVQRINCHHNYTTREQHHGKSLWVTRKGAIRARVGDLGVIPGSMGTASYIVAGLGNPASYDSCSHGAGRRLSRTAARKTLTVESLREVMGSRVWNGNTGEQSWQKERDARSLLDEHPAAYKDIDAVMAAQADLVEVKHTLHQILNYKGS